MNPQYQHDALSLMQSLCTHVGSNLATPSIGVGISDYIAQRSAIQHVFDETNGLNYNQQSILLRLIVIDSLYSTNARYSYYAIDRLAGAIAALGTEKNVADYFYSIACGGADYKNVFSAKYGVRKNLNDGNRQTSLLSKYAYYALLQDVVSYPLGFPIYDKLVIDMYPKVCAHLCIAIQTGFSKDIASYVTALSAVRNAFFGSAHSLFCGMQQFDALDIYLWRMGKLCNGNYSLLFDQTDYTIFIQNIKMKGLPTKNFDAMVCQKCRTMSTASIVSGIKHATLIGRMIDHWKRWF